MVSTASWAPWNRGSSSITTPNPPIVQPVRRCQTHVLNSAVPRHSTSCFPADPHCGKLQNELLRLNTPATAHAAWWWPLKSSERPHRQERPDEGNCNHKRRNRRTRNGCGSNHGERKRACCVPKSRGRTTPSRKPSSTGRVALRCQPCRGTRGPSSTNSSLPERWQSANACQSGDMGLEETLPGCTSSPEMVVVQGIHDVATVGCLAFTIARQSAQLAKCAAARPRSVAETEPSMAEGQTGQLPSVVRTDCSNKFRTTRRDWQQSPN